jgi:hypothetical protein
MDLYEAISKLYEKVRPCIQALKDRWSGH